MGMAILGRVVLAAALLATSGCAARAVYEDRDLDSGLHSSRAVPLSVSRPAPTRAQLELPVAIATHGFSSTTWELEPLQAALEARGIQVSPVTLGAHGVSLDAFEASDWQAWQAPLIAEYKALRRQGYKKISLVGHSTGATLWLKALADGSLGTVPARMVFVAPLIEFAAPTRAIYYAAALPAFGVEAVERPLYGKSVGRLYRFRPVSALTTLADVTVQVRRRLKRGLALPAATKVLIVQGDQDGVVAPEGAKLLVDGLVGPEARLLMVGSWMHNPVGPDGIQGHDFTEAEAALRERLLGAIADHLAE